jgi:hypothetical protein
VKARKKETARGPKKPARGQPVKKTGKKETATELENIFANPPMPEELVKKIAKYYAEIQSMLESYAVHLLPQDRRRLNGVRIRTQGFIDKAYQNAEAFPSLLPNNVTFEKFSEDYDYFNSFQNLITNSNRAHEFLWNITLKAADAAYADARAFYGSVRLLAKSKFESSTTVYEVLFPFFKRTRKAGAPPARKKVMRDANALLSGKKDGEVIIRNLKPKVIRGRREVVDEEFTTNKHEAN